MFDAFDLPIIAWVNQFAGQSKFLDKFVTEVMASHSASLLPLILCLWWIWFAERPAPRNRAAEQLLGEQAARGLSGSRARHVVIETGIAVVLALVVSRLIQDLAPYHPRPIHAGIPFVLPIGQERDVLANWSSFPSDHAAMGLALAAGIWRRKALLGAAAVLWAALMVCFPRLYAGWHYPSDLIAGGLIGVACVVAVAAAAPLFRGLSNGVLSLEARHRPAFYTLALFAAFQVATMFDDIRTPARALPHAIQALVEHR
jgi:undecaprenyl-diphosphatase